MQHDYFGAMLDNTSTTYSPISLCLCRDGKGRKEKGKKKEKKKEKNGVDGPSIQRNTPSTGKLCVYSLSNRYHPSYGLRSHHVILPARSELRCDEAGQRTA